MISEPKVEEKTEGRPVIKAVRPDRLEAIIRDAYVLGSRKAKYPEVQKFVSATIRGLPSRAC